MSFNYLSVSGLIIFCLCSITAIMVLLNKKDDKAALIWGLFCMSVALWGGGLWCSFSTEVLKEALLWSRVLNLFAMFIPVFFFHFIIEFIGASRLKRWNFFSYLFGGTMLFCSLIWPNLLIPSVYTPRLAIAFYPKAGPLFYLFAIHFSVAVLVSFSLLLQKYKETKIDAHKQQLRIFIGALLVGFSGGATTFPLVFGISIYPYGIIGPALLALIVAFSIIKFSLMDIKLAVTKTGAFLVTLAIFGSAYLIGIVWPYFIFISKAIDIPFLILSIAYGGLGVGLFFHRVQEFLITTAEKRFVRSKYDTQLLLQNISSQLISLADRSSIIQMIGEEFVQTMELKGAQAIIPQEKQVSILRINWKNERVVSNLESGRKIRQEILAAFKEMTGPALWVKSSKEKMKADQFLADIGGHSGSVILPMNSLEKLECVLILGPKLIEKKYTEIDLAMLSFIVNQIIVVFDRISYQEKLKTSNEELKVLNKDLESKVKQGIALAQKYFHQAALASLVSGIGHEIRNPMSSILGAVGQRSVARALPGIADSLPPSLQKGNRRFPF